MIEGRRQGTGTLRSGRFTRRPPVMSDLGLLPEGRVAPPRPQSLRAPHPLHESINTGFRSRGALETPYTGFSAPPLTSNGTCCRHWRAAPPLIWFLPGPERMRGGAARRFASVRHFHRGSQAEATLRAHTEIPESDQRLAESRSGRGGFPAGIQGSPLRGSQAARSHPRKPIR